MNNTKENISNSTVAKQRNLQAEAAHQNQHIETSQGAMQAGARRYTLSTQDNSPRCPVHDPATLDSISYGSGIRRDKRPYISFMT